MNKPPQLPDEIRITDIAFQITSNCANCDFYAGEPDENGHLCIYEWDNKGIPGESCPDPGLYGLILGKIEASQIVGEPKP